MLRLCQRPQRMRRPATKWLPPLNLLIRIRRKIVSHHLKPGSDPNSPFKMLRDRLRKMPRHQLPQMPEHGFGLCKKTDTSGPSITRGQRYGPCKILEKRSGTSKLHGQRSRPHKTREHKTSLCKSSCKSSVGAIRLPWSCADVVPLLGRQAFEDSPRRGADAKGSPDVGGRTERAKFTLAPVSLRRGRT